MNDIEQAVKTVQESNYLNPSRYISGRIIEYDIKAANISSLKESNAISDEYYLYLQSVPKMEREICIGNDIKNNPELYTIIQTTIKQSKTSLITSNNIVNNQIIRVANDAVYINTPIDLKYTEFGKYIKFVNKGIYNVYLKLFKNVIFISLLQDGNVDIDVKGIGKNLYLHQGYMLTIIANCISLLERDSSQSAGKYLSDIISQYTSRTLPVEFYREFNSDSLYKINNHIDNFGYFGVTNVYDKDKNALNIDYNLALLRELWSIIVEIYQRKGY